jgi:hypothetical protein
MTLTQLQNVRSTHVRNYGSFVHSFIISGQYRRSYSIVVISLVK